MTPTAIMSAMNELSSTIASPLSVAPIPMPAPPLIPIELAEPILTYHVLLHTPPLPAPAPVGPTATTAACPSAILAPLNTLPRSLIPDVTRAAFVQLWWLSLDDVPASCLDWMLPMLVDLDTRGRRPLVYSTRGLCAAARRGDMTVLDMWLHAGLVSRADHRSSKLYLARHAAAQSGPADHLLRVLTWWAQHKLPWGDRAALETDLVLALDTRVLAWWKAQGLIAWPPPEALVHASREGRVDLLTWWAQQYPQHVTHVTVDVVDAAVEGGRVHVLQWWLDRFPIASGTSAAGVRPQDQMVLKHVANLASRLGHAHVLDWWLEQRTRLPKVHFKWSILALDHAAAAGHLHVLEWWRTHAESHGLKLKYKWALDWACAAGRLDILDWFARHQQGPHHRRWRLMSGNACPLLYWPAAHARSVSVACLDWRLKQGIATRMSAKGMAWLSQAGRHDVLDWISANSIPFLADEHAINKASHAGHLHVLDWWAHTSGVQELKYSSLLVLDTPHLPVLQWWADHASKVRPEMDLSYCLCLSSHVDRRDIFTWALQHTQAPETILEHCIELCIERGDFDMLEYCLQTFPRETYKALHEFGLHVAIHHGQLGMVSFLVHHGILTPHELDDLVNGFRQAELSRLAHLGSLAFLDWIRRHRARQPEAPPLFVTQSDVDAARDRGDLGFRRWVKRRQVEVRDHAFVDLGDEFGDNGGAGQQFENGFLPEADEDEAEPLDEGSGSEGGVWESDTGGDDSGPPPEP